jgi:N6-L-threonylcarbamoyladenine synthase
VDASNGQISCTKIGGTSDISVGQLIDRTGQLLQLPFPSGKHIDSLSAGASLNAMFRVKCKESEFSISGVQNKVQQFYEQHLDASETAAYALRSVCDVIYRATDNAMIKYPGLPVVFSGGVASNSMLRSVLAPLNPIFAQPQYSTDNAMGIAVLTYLNQGG